MVYCVGLTGTIASGKSTAAQAFASFGAHVISADNISTALTQPGQAAFQAILKHFGASAVMSSGELNRRYLRAIIFDNASERLWLEQLLHPLIHKQIQQEIAHCISAYCIIEIPLLIDKASYPYLDRVLLILAKKKQQIARLIQRDRSSIRQALAIFKAQADIKMLKALSDDIIINHGTLIDINQQVVVLHAQYLRYRS